MKKIIAMMMSLLLVLGCFCACAPSETPTPPQGEIITQTETPTTAAPVEQVLFTNEQASFVLTSNPYADGFWGQMIDVRLENNADTSLMFSLDEVSINGYMIDVLFASDIAAGKKENTSITIFSSELEKNKITTIETIEFELHIYNSENWEAPDIVQQTFVINFSN